MSAAYQKIKIAADERKREERDYQTDLMGLVEPRRGLRTAETSAPVNVLAVAHIELYPPPRRALVCAHRPSVLVCCSCLLS